MVFSPLFLSHDPPLAFLSFPASSLLLFSPPPSLPPPGVWPPLGSKAGRVCSPLLPVGQADAYGPADVNRRAAGTAGRWRAQVQVGGWSSPPKKGWYRGKWGGGDPRDDFTLKSFCDCLKNVPSLPTSPRPPRGFLSRGRGKARGTLLEVLLTSC